MVRPHLHLKTPIVIFRRENKEGDGWKRSNHDKHHIETPNTGSWSSQITKVTWWQWFWYWFSSQVCLCILCWYWILGRLCAQERDTPAVGFHVAMDSVRRQHRTTRLLYGWLESFWVKQSRAIEWVTQKKTKKRKQFWYRAWYFTYEFDIFAVTIVELDSFVWNTELREEKKKKEKTKLREFLDFTQFK